jgi:hypothetical protein
LTSVFHLNLITFCKGKQSAKSRKFGALGLADDGVIELLLTPLLTLNLRRTYCFFFFFLTVGWWD